MFLKVRPHNQHILLVELNRPEKLNVLSAEFWTECLDLFSGLKFGSSGPSDDYRNRWNLNTTHGKGWLPKIVVIAGSGRSFCAGIDVYTLKMDQDESHSNRTSNTSIPDPALVALNLKRRIELMQNALNAIESCDCLVIAAMHGYILGSGLELALACDLRICDIDSKFGLTEVQLGLCADLGGIQRLTRASGGNHAMMRYLIHSGDTFDAKTAKEIGIVSHHHYTPDTIQDEAIKMAEKLSGLERVAILGNKINIKYAQDHDMNSALEYQQVWSSSMLQSRGLRSDATRSASARAKM